MKQKKILQHTSRTREDLSADYLKKQLIAYIGNKRSLLNFLGDVFYSLTGDADSSQFFMDPFAGSGSVSRLAKYLGYSVLSNDWEHYSYIINSCYISVNKNDINEYFKKYNGLDKLLEYFNDAPKNTAGFISENYAPENTQAADYKTERLFYTRENALFIDFVRSEIERLYPENKISETERIEKNILLASLLYECATHANTSGVFKAYHKGFGGFGKDALSRIMSPMQLEKPFLVNGSSNCRVFREDAECFLEKQSGRICYLDPPYNIHQYGSNYHLLNTIALWDMPEISNKHKADESLEEKAGIRKDWMKRRSDFCRAGKASVAFRNLLENIDSEYTVLSYNTEGIIPFEEICDTMAEFGSIDIRCKDYVKYKGGKQSLNRKINNIEFVLILNKSEKRKSRSKDEIDHLLNARKILIGLKMSYSPFRLKNYFKTKGNKVNLFADCFIETHNFHLFKSEPDIKTLMSLSSSDLLILKEELELCMCKSKKEEAEILLEFLKKAESKRDINFYMKRFLNALRKFTFKKYRKEFLEIFEKLELEVASDKEKYAQNMEKIENLKKIAGLRFNG